MELTKFQQHERVNDTISEPSLPLLSIDELPQLIDLRDHLPVAIQSRLGEDDIVAHISTPNIQRSRQRPAALREMLRLTKASSSDDIGESGAALASLASLENSTVAELRKYETPHGRDALEIARKLHEHHPKLLRATILELAQSQGLEYEEYRKGEPVRQEQPGKIILLDRGTTHDTGTADPMAQKFSKRLNWGWPFYGSIDATPSYIQAIHTYAMQHNASILAEPYIGKDGQERTVADSLALATHWLQERLAENPEGLLEFKNLDPTGKGIDSQAWKDSAFAYVHADGSRANYNNGIASVEVQALAYDALIDSAELYAATNPAHADQLRQQAEQLRERILAEFWIDDPKKGGYFALATDRDEQGNLRQLAVRTSNMGRLLNSRLLEGDGPDETFLRESIVRQLFRPELLHHSGIRTLASDEVAFRAGSYHTGSVWLWDTAYVADGLERQGYEMLAWELRSRIWRTVYDTNSFPEFVNGNTDDSIETNPHEIYVWNTTHQVLHLFEQPPQEIQGWTVSAILAAKYGYKAYLSNPKPISDFEQAISASIYN